MDKKKFIIEWNRKFSKDLWYRKKYNIAFNSEAHRSVTPLDIALEYEEDRLIEKEKNRKLLLEERSKLYLEGKIVVKREESEEETQQFFDSLNLDSFNGRE